MLKVKPFLLFIILTMFVTLFTTACSNTGDSSTGLGDLLNPKVTEVSVRESNVTLGLADNKTYEIIVTITPSNAVNKEVTYSSSDESIAEVSSTGIITPKKEGVATITVTSVDNPDAKATITVNVIASSGDNQGGNTGGDTDTGTDIKWDNLPSSPITGTSSVFDEELPAPDTPVDPDDILALIGHYRIQYMTIAGPDGSKVVDNIVGSGNNMRGEIAVNATACTPDPVSCPVGLTIKMQYKSQFHKDIVSQGIPSTIEYVRKDIYSPLSSIDIADIAGEFAKLGAEIVEDTNKPGEYVVKFTLKSPDLPMPQGYTMQVTLKKIADDAMLQSTIELDDTRYWSAGGETGPVKVTGITVTNSIIGLEVGQTAKLNYAITPLDAENKAVVFASYDDKIAKISEDGTITAVGIGKTEVEVRTVDGGFSEKAVVTVVDKLINVEGIESGSEEVTLDINQDPQKAKRTADVKFNVTPRDATNKTILLKDGYDKNLIDAKIVNDIDGVATLSISAKLSTGTTDITVYAEGNNSVEKTISVTVNDTTIHPTDIEINESNIQMTVDDTKQLTATVTPDEAYNKTVKWASDNIYAVTVDENTGVITAVGAGVATITAKTVDGNLQAACKVTVSNKHVAVTGVSFSEETAKFGQNATDISVVANVIPSDATNKGITYESSNPEKVQVDAATGALTIIDKGSTSDYSVTITAKSNENELLTDTITVTITSNFVAVTNVTITNKLASPYELKLGATYTPEYTVEPEDATNTHVIISSEGDVLTYDAESKTFTANRAGTATITVKSESNPDVQDTFTVTVWEPANITGKYNVKSLEIQYNGESVKSSEAAKDGYLYDEKEFAVSTADGQLKISGKMQLVWSQFITQPAFDVFRYKYFTHTDTISDRENSVDKLVEKGFTINSDGTITYEFPFNVQDDNTLVYSAGSANKLILTLDNKQPYSEVIAGKMRHLTPVNFADPYTIMGTYDMLTFVQTNNMGYNVGAKYSTDGEECIKEGIFGICSEYAQVDSLSRMIGEITAVVDTTAKTVEMKSKIQMNSKMLESNPVGQTTNTEQFQNTTYDMMTYSLDTITTGFGQGTSKTSGTVTLNNEEWEGQKSDIKIYSTFKQFGIATVEVSVYGKKKSDDVITLDANMPYYCNDYFYLPEAAKANCPISNEPTGKGYVTQLWQ